MELCLQPSILSACFKNHNGIIVVDIDRYSNIFVTAPSPENLRTLFEFVFKGFDALDYQVCVELTSNKSYVCNLLPGIHVCFVLFLLKLTKFVMFHHTYE